jgi:hypothetical protein
LKSVVLPSFRAWRGRAGTSRASASIRDWRFGGSAFNCSERPSLRFRKWELLRRGETWNARHCYRRPSRQKSRWLALRWLKTAAKKLPQFLRRHIARECKRFVRRRKSRTYFKATTDRRAGKEVSIAGHVPISFIRRSRRSHGQGASMDIGRWLQEFGLEQYEAARAINEKVLPNLTAEDLRPFEAEQVSTQQSETESGSQSDNRLSPHEILPAPPRSRAGRVLAHYAESLGRFRHLP